MRARIGDRELGCVMKAKDVMTRKVVAIGPDATVEEAARLMLANRVSGIPVVDAEGSLCGVVSEGDFLRRRPAPGDRRRSRWLEFLADPARLTAEFAAARPRLVRDAMTPEVQCVDEGASLETVIEVMERFRIKRVPVLHDGKMAGIVTRANLMRAMVSLARSSLPIGTDDAAIRERLLVEYQKEQCAPAAVVNVVVRGGVVELWGVIVDERQRAVLRLAAENVPGVTAVYDHLVWVDSSGLGTERADTRVKH